MLNPIGHIIWLMKQRKSKYLINGRIRISIIIRIRRRKCSHQSYSEIHISLFSLYTCRIASKQNIIGDAQLITFFEDLSSICQTTYNRHLSRKNDRRVPTSTNRYQETIDLLICLILHVLASLRGQRLRGRSPSTPEVTLTVGAPARAGRQAELQRKRKRNEAHAPSDQVRMNGGKKQTNYNGFSG